MTCQKNLDLIVFQPTRCQKGNEKRLKSHVSSIPMLPQTEMRPAHLTSKLTINQAKLRLFSIQTSHIINLAIC